jgi:hypothetical protein
MKILLNVAQLPAMEIGVFFKVCSHNCIFLKLPPIMPPILALVALTTPSTEDVFGEPGNLWMKKSTM